MHFTQRQPDQMMIGEISLNSANLSRKKHLTLEKVLSTFLVQMGPFIQAS